MRPKILSWFGAFFIFGVAALFAFPFLWMFFATFKSNPEIFTPFPVLPKTFTGEYFAELFSGKWIPYFRQFGNTMYICVLQTLGALALSLTAGYIFGTYSFRYKKIWFFAALLVILIPKQILVLPLFIWMNKLSLWDTPYSVIFPGIASGIGVLYFTQLYRIFPKTILDLARVEGATERQVFALTLPLLIPHMLTFTLIHFILAWQEHIIPMVMLNTSEKQTLSVALSSLYGGSMRIPYALLMVGSLFTVLPPAVYYIFVRKHFQSTLKEFQSNG